MKLQINLSGSWRDVIQFNERDLDIAKEHATSLASIADGKRPGLRIADDKNNAIERCTAPFYVWTKA